MTRFQKIKRHLERILLTDAFENIFHLFCFVFYIAFSLICTGVAIAIMIFVLERLFPKDVHVLNYTLTDNTFKELYGNHHYHAAIFLAENDTSYVSLTEMNYPNRDMLRDCYLHVGEYSKAEKIGREFLDFNYDISTLSEKNADFARLSVDVSRAVAARDLFRLYEKMGDKGKQLEMYEIIKKYGNDPRIKTIEQKIAEQGMELPKVDEAHKEMYSVWHNLKYDLICGLYLENKEAAIDSLKNYISEVWAIPHFNASLKLSFINKLISWHLERNELFEAQRALLYGLSIVPNILNEAGLDPLGDFAEYCYILHDTKNAKRYMNRYMRFMDKFYDDEDLEYLHAEARFIKYKNEVVNNKIDELSHCCRGLRKQISKNFAGMTATQQEYFAQTLSKPFSYALELLNANPGNKELTELCFENEVFNRGLMLRTDALLRQALKDSNDASLATDYDKYLQLKRELIAREGVNGPGNYAKKIILKNDIAKLEKKLADGCAEFTRANNSDADISEIKSSLSPKESLVTYVEMPQTNGKSLAAFVLNKRNGLKFLPLCSSQELKELESMDMIDLCKDDNSYKHLFASIESLLTGTRNILYSPSGIIHRTPLAALKTDEHSTLGDKYTLAIIGNAIDLAKMKVNEKIDMNKMGIALWGGIDYGGDSQTKGITTRTRAIVERGIGLEYLPGSKAEIDGISSILKGNVNKVLYYSGHSATEESFKTKSSESNILHISTHGFFYEDEEHRQESAMHNSGLLFAKANNAWTENYKPEQFREGYEDGILRAEEIESLNLASCRLVVLSACETGLGSINGNEGVFGLQRAFKLAGAKCIIMSLWSVSDNATEELMKHFYSYLLVEQDIDVAFSKAQQTMRASSIYNDIVYWGGFVLLH